MKNNNIQNYGLSGFALFLPGSFITDIINEIVTVKSN
jgi:hypothetical protein